MGGEGGGKLPHKLRLARWAFFPVGGGSLRRATRSLLPLSLKGRAIRKCQSAGRLLSRLGPFPYFLLPLVVFASCVDIQWGVLGDGRESEQYLQTLWQVVAASLALSVAMIGFVFEAFANATRRSLGGSLSDFTRATRLDVALWLGFAALICNGMVLLEIGHDAPGGWAALWAIFLSAATVGVALPFVFSRTVRALDFDYLVALRGRQIDTLVERAMEHQLRGQAGDMLLVQQYKARGVTRGLGVDPDYQDGIDGKASRVLFDLRIERLQRLAEPLHDGDREPVEILAALHDPVTENEVVAVKKDQGWLWKRSVEKSVRYRRQRDGDLAARRLTDELEGLHEAALAAIREYRAGDWEKISQIYSRALLAMPKATAAMDIPFAGAVASPGIFRPLGPLDRIERFLYAELVAAVKADDWDLAREVAYFPVLIAQKAADLDAPALVRAMLALYPRLYRETLTS